MTLASKVKIRDTLCTVGTGDKLIQQRMIRQAIYKMVKTCAYFFSIFLMLKSLRYDRENISNCNISYRTALLDIKIRGISNPVFHIFFNGKGSGT